MAIDSEKIKNTGKILETVINLIAKIGDKIKKLRRNSITYRELLNEIITSKPGDSSICQCAVMKDTLSTGEIRLTIVYMDSENTPVFTSKNGVEKYGCEITVKTIDQELIDAFNGKSLLIFK